MVMCGTNVCDNHTHFPYKIINNEQEAPELSLNA